MYYVNVKDLLGSYGVLPSIILFNIPAVMHKKFSVPSSHKPTKVDLDDFPLPLDP